MSRAINSPAHAQRSTTEGAPMEASHRISRFDVEMRRMREQFENRRRGIEQAHDQQFDQIEQKLVKDHLTPFVSEDSRSAFITQLTALLADLNERDHIEDSMQKCCDEIGTALGKTVQTLDACLSSRIMQCDPA